MTSSTVEALKPENGKVYVGISGLTGSGKSAVYAEVVIALTALGLAVEHTDPDAWRGEMGLLSVGGNDPHDFTPTIVMTETNIARSPK